MDFLQRTIEVIDVNLVYCLVPMIATLITVRWIYKDKFQVRKALIWIKWFMIAYTLVSFLYYLFLWTTDPESVAISSRATGPYKWAYWLMFLGTLSPLLLLFKRIGSNAYLMLTIAILMKVGMYMERFIILFTSFHRDYLSDWAVSVSTPFLGLILILLQGIGLAVVLLVVLELIKKRPSEV